MVVTLVAACVLALACLRYLLIYRRFRIPEHLMMAGGAGISIVGAAVLGGDLVRFLIGLVVMAWGVGLWIDGEIQILGNLRWRKIRSGWAWGDMLLLRFPEIKGT